MIFVRFLTDLGMTFYDLWGDVWKNSARIWDNFLMILLLLLLLLFFLLILAFAFGCWGSVCRAWWRGGRRQLRYLLYLRTPLRQDIPVRIRHRKRPVPKKGYRKCKLMRLSGRNAKNKTTRKHPLPKKLQKKRYEWMQLSRQKA